jgi:hypothetical protein
MNKLEDDDHFNPFYLSEQDCASMRDPKEPDLELVLLVAGWPPCWTLQKRGRSISGSGRR